MGGERQRDCVVEFREYGNDGCIWFAENDVNINSCDRRRRKQFGRTDLCRDSLGSQWDYISHDYQKQLLWMGSWIQAMHQDSTGDFSNSITLIYAMLSRC
jgi:hypothetical protein